ncbi:alpha/beta fold hydrolase [Roseitranquillus sediminis]|uniref:alpha/beta fold hydrolase n=1 Tax=Roseitranquillus sediminis TaxID=2809051 RepID=UPI001D0C4BE8|nr:alpha/beta fold hydrolase [Roseitranquillus sediminis]MBM9594080.1 alpha/beta fold hydrolase [Roseitranquillus sediminis]
MERRHARIDGLRVSWLELGPRDGTPMVVLHGGGLDRAGVSWGPALPALARRHRIFAPDLPGHGESDLFSGSYRVPDVGRWLVALLDTLELECAILAGLSLGGAVALWTALATPGRISAVIPVASYGLAPVAPLHPLAFLGTRLPVNRLAYPLIARSDFAAREALATIVHDRASITPDLLRDVRQLAAAARPHAYDRFLRDEIGPNGLGTCLIPRLPGLGPPALFIHGRHDRPVPIAAARAAARAAGARLVELDTGHWPMVEAPGPFDAALDHFLQRLGRDRNELH